MTTRPPEIELASIVLQWNLKTELGQRAHELAREILGKSPFSDAEKGVYIRIILELEKDMPRLEDLKKNLLNMSPEELRARIREIREDRIIRKDSGKTKVKKAKVKDNAQAQLAKLLASMSDAEREAFMKEIDG